MAVNFPQGSVRNAAIAAGVMLAVVFGVTQLRTKTEIIPANVPLDTEQETPRRKPATRIARLREVGTPVARRTNSTALTSPTATGASAGVQTTGIASTFYLPMRGPTGALASNVGLNGPGLGLADSDQFETTETRQEKWKQRGLQLVPVRMVDMTSRPLEGVRVVVDGIHQGQRGRATGVVNWDTKRFGPPPWDVTDAEGRAYVASPVILTDLAEAIGISFTASKPAYAKRRVYDYPVDGSERDEVLRKGNALIVMAYMGTKDQRAFGFIPTVSSASHSSGQLKPEDWTQLPDGRQSTEAVPDGKHGLTVQYKATDGTTWNSDSVLFEMRGGEGKELEVELKPGLTLRGQFSPNVRRPVVHGRVIACTQWPPPGSSQPGAGATTMRESSADVAADGTFEIGGLPEGPGEIIGLCDGYIAAHRELTARPFEQNQRYDLKPGDTTPFVLIMEETGNLRVRIMDNAGNPLPGATMTVSPNVYWAVGVSSLYIDESLWTATADPKGFAVIKGLRPGPNGYAAQAPGWAPPVRVVDGQASRGLNAAIVAGLTTELGVYLEPVPVDGSTR